ncbi:cell division control protein 1 [Biomphalaria pfeifferi]|uniref:Cell division control protein 1 n=1 Tax=Biomphalaria pfeifferi TaxID=112525 RepID=A0AAD8AW28_BIOPF|nr:cell division control protein 1 [Biomphalaria pfeifferi]
MVSVLLMQRRLRNLTINKLVVILLLTAAAFNEFLVYTFQSFRWQSIPLDRDPGEEMVILLISDPQLIGIQDEIGFPVGMLARWDSDSFLRKTFSRVYEHTRPDVIIFLGDIMDEGSKATDAEYQSYVERFDSIFYEKVYTKTIVVPGDNDIGGEGSDFRTQFKVSRFEKHFENLTGVVSHKFVDFLKLDNRRSHDMIIETKQLIHNMASRLKAPYRFIVNHESMIAKPKSSIYPILYMAQPNLIFSGHWHLSQMFTCETCLSDNEDMNYWPFHHKDISNVADFVEVDLTTLIALSEIMVPTCSYRMGVPNMGYGVAVLNKSGHLNYTVLWLPSRYKLLYIYIGVLAFVAVLLIIEFIFWPLSTKDLHR